MDSQKYYHKDLRQLIKRVAPDLKTTLVLNNSLANIDDIQNHLITLYKKFDVKKRLIVIYYNHLWQPILWLASYLGLRKKSGEQNWLDENDIKNLLELSGFEVITSQKRMLLPLDIPYISNLVNKYLAFLPLINSLCLTTYLIARKKSFDKRKYSVSIIIPARNEAGNISKIVRSLPFFGSSQEIIFVEGHSSDDTWQKILNEIIKAKKAKGNLVIKAFKQKGKGKADAVRFGFKKASGEILMIYDADRTVNAKDLSKFYNALVSRHGEFINGSRLVYPMEKDAMRTLNKIGNKIFSILFTWIFGQRFKDTLCGTKAFFKSDYLKFKRFKDDPFGDFELIFGAIKNNLKVVEIPVRYKERVYGSTNISRFKHGLLLFKITWLAFKTFKAW